MLVNSFSIDGILEFIPNSYQDSRGFFYETFNLSKYKDFLPQGTKFVQDNLSYSKKGVIRGLHLQLNSPQGKLVYVLSGEVLDIAIDLRPESLTFGKFVTIKISSNKRNQLWIPKGFAHGFQCLSDEAIFCYKCTDFYNPSDELTILYNDSDLNINWEEITPIISEKDLDGLTLKEFINKI